MLRPSPRRFAALPLAATLAFPVLSTEPAEAQVANEYTLIHAQTPTIGEHFGIDCAVDGGRALIGSGWIHPTPTVPGAAYVFEVQADGSWLETEVLTAAAPGPGDNFGNAVDLDGERAIVGASHKDSSGPLGLSVDVHLFERQPDGSWPVAAQLSVPSGSAAICR